MVKIIIVAGGLATRMRPITEEIPKCLIDINGKPLIQHQLEFFKKKGYKDIKEEVILKRTHKIYGDWKKILDKFNVEKNGQKAAAEYLKNKYNVNPWWAQVLVIRYEYERKIKRGRR